MNKYKLKFYNNAYDLDENVVEYFYNFNDAYEKAREIIADHLIEEKQIYVTKDSLPFKASVHIASLYDDLKIKDEEIIVFEKLILVFNHMLETNDSIVNFIKNDVYYDYKNENDWDCSFQINRKKDKNLVLDIHTGEDYLITNMFNVRDNYEYFFESYQEVIAKCKYDRRHLGEKVYLKVELSKM